MVKLESYVWWLINSSEKMIIKKIINKKLVYLINRDLLTHKLI
jgi:hypothetical protein